ncbi:hypothetical protein RJ641_012078 [Dillenia turbinata]|uniref:Uncharacterized protein n=1 Tax=Dillenia turbinata TaxID=194707 RepID=A0AAN8Z1X2_9MAGN
MGFGIFVDNKLWTSVLRDVKECQVPLVEEARGSRHNGNNQQVVVVEGESDFWPIEHPMEPPDEDRPLKCPIPDSSLINDGNMKKEQFGDRFRKRTEESCDENKERMVVLAPEPPVRSLRKRHHPLTRGDYTITPMIRRPPMPPFQTENVTIFQMLQHFNEFEHQGAKAQGDKVT